MNAVESWDLEEVVMGEDWEVDRWVERIIARRIVCGMSRNKQGK